MRRAALTLVTLGALAGCDRVFGVEGAPDGPPPDAPPPSTALWDHVATGENSSCGIRLDHTLWCWGRNEIGELGLGTQDAIGKREPAEVGSDADWDSVSITVSTACAIKQDHSLWCWGNNSDGQIGNNTLHMDPSAPTRIDGSWKHVAVGATHACGIQDDDTLWCWGDGSMGRLGLASEDAHLAPAQLTGTWKSVSTGYNSTCAIATDDTLWCWGQGEFGQLGSGPGAPQQLVPMQVDTGTWSAVTAFASSACGVTSDGKALCWGVNANGQLGTQTTSPADVPTPVMTADGIAGWTAITGGAEHACGLRGDGELLCWGANSRGEVGAGLGSADKLTPSKIQGGPWLSVSAGFRHTCAIDKDHRLWCAGNAATNVLGTGDGDALEPHLVGDYSQPAAGIDVTCATGANGLTCWGGNVGGILGTGERDNNFTLQQPTGSLGAFQSYAAGDHVCALQAGQRYCWGENYAGQLGSGTTDYEYSPRAFGAEVWSKIAVSAVHSCGLDTSGTAWCWGRNIEGEVGDGTNTSPALLPLKVTGSLTWAAIATGSVFTCGIATDLNVYCWGYTYEGELANNYGVPSHPTPARIGSVAVAYTKLFVGGKHACAIEASGVARCWGGNYYGQIGDGASGDGADRFAPQQLTGTWRSFGLGKQHSCGIKTDGSLWCWGANSNGQLGIGSTMDQSSPQQVGSDVDWKDVVGGDAHTCATKGDDPVLYCWGSQEHGAVGDGTAWFGAFREVLH